MLSQMAEVKIDASSGRTFKAFPDTDSNGYLDKNKTICWLPRWLSGKESCQAGDLGSIAGSGRSPGKGNGNPFQYSCLRSPMDRRDWQTAVHGVTESQTQLSD